MKSIIYLLIFLFIPQLALAVVPNLPEDITAANFPKEYERVVTTYDNIIANNSKTLIRKFKKTKGKQSYRFTAKQNRVRQDYKKLIEQMRFLEPMNKLRIALNDLYLEYYAKTSFDREALNRESTELAIGLIKQAEVLRKKYKSFFIPIFHNMMMDVGIKKRGACKHWAEDILEYVRPIKREFFYAAWGEANMGTFMEHNVAVLIPEGRPFEDGLMFDPWRTSGNPFWVKLKDDKHYRWQRWLTYGEF